MRTVEWRDDRLFLVDQRKLPWKLEYLSLEGPDAVARAISDMAVRGAPAIGAAAAFGMALAARVALSDGLVGELLRERLQGAAEMLKSSRPTAVNLAWAVERQMRLAEKVGYSEPGALADALLAEAQRIADEDVEVNRRMGRYGADLIEDGFTILHHCNTGALATVDYGTALGVIRAAHEQGKRIHVLLDETRPRLQGARLSAWELKQLGIPFHIIADNAAGHFMRTGQVDLVLVGADRVAANGDVANKIGTYKLAVTARENGIPFYSVAPTSTIDLSIATGDDIPIEERDPAEVRTAFGHPIVPDDYPALNPAFDVTPHRYLTGIVTENGIAYPPFGVNLRRAVEGSL